MGWGVHASGWRCQWADLSEDLMRTCFVFVFKVAIRECLTRFQFFIHNIFPLHIIKVHHFIVHHSNIMPGISIVEFSGQETSEYIQTLRLSTFLSDEAVCTPRTNTFLSRFIFSFIYCCCAFIVAAPNIIEAAQLSRFSNEHQKRDTFVTWPAVLLEDNRAIEAQHLQYHCVSEGQTMTWQLRNDKNNGRARKKFNALHAFALRIMVILAFCFYF